MTVALARGQIKASGPVAKILKLVPLTKPVYPRYKAQLEAAGPRRPGRRRLSAKADAEQWAEIVKAWRPSAASRYEPIGGINPKDGPVALCPGGTNRLTGELSDGFFGSSCDADEHEEGGFGRKAILPARVLVKSHMPDLATVVPVFNVESIERTAGDTLDQHSRRRVEFESVDFNKRFIATVPRDHDPVALRELFSPAFIDWITRIPARGRLRNHRAAALLPLAAARALQGGTEGGASLGGRHLRAAPSRDGGEQPRHLQARPLERGSGAVPSEDRLLSGQPAGAGSPEAAASIRAISIFPIVE